MSRSLNFLILICVLFGAAITRADSSTPAACGINPHLRSAIETVTGLDCKEIGTGELLKITELDVDLGGSVLQALDFLPGLLPQSLSLTNIGNPSMVGVLAPLARVRNLRLSLSFVGQTVDFFAEDYAGYFKELDLESLRLGNFKMIFRETFSLDPEHFLGGQTQTTKVSVNHTNISYIPFHFFDGVTNTVRDVDFADNQISFFVGEVVGGLPNLESVDLSGNPLDTESFAMPIRSCGDVKVKACRMGPKFDRTTFKSRVTRKGPTCICDGRRACEIQFDFCDASETQK